MCFAGDERAGGGLPTGRGRGARASGTADAEGGCGGWAAAVGLLYMPAWIAFDGCSAIACRRAHAGEEDRSQHRDRDPRRKNEPQPSTVARATDSVRATDSAPPSTVPTRAGMSDLDRMPRAICLELAPGFRSRACAGPRGTSTQADRRYYHIATMTATSIKLPPELKERVVAAAEAAGKSPHAFMLDAIERQTVLAETRRAFVQEAMTARESMDETGLGYEAAEVHAYLAAKRGRSRKGRPKPSRWRG